MKFGHIVPTLFQENSKENILSLINYAEKHSIYNLYFCYTKEKVKASDFEFLINLINQNKDIKNIHFISGRKGIYRSMNDALIFSNDEWLYFSGDSDEINTDNI